MESSTGMYKRNEIEVETLSQGYGGPSACDQTGRREMLQMLHGNNNIPSELSKSIQSESSGSWNVPVGNNVAPGDKPSKAKCGISILPWDMFLKEPKRLDGLLDVREDQYISFDSEKINAFFRATYMDESILGDISETGDAWIITVNGGADMETLRHVLTQRVSILGMSIARYRGKWRTATKVPCLVIVDPASEAIRETLDNALTLAKESLDRGKHFCIELDLNGCVETWCSRVLGVRCQSLGAKITLTSGEPYEAVLTGDGILCCVLCFPLWALHSCLYKIHRRGTHDDHFLPINGDVRLQGTDAQEITSSPGPNVTSTKSNDSISNEQETNIAANSTSTTELFQTVQTCTATIGDTVESPAVESNRKSSSRSRGSKKSKSDLKSFSSVGRRGQTNNAFENDELAAAHDIRAIRNAIAARNKQSLAKENGHYTRDEGEAEKIKNINELEVRGSKAMRGSRGQSFGPPENVIDNSIVELTKYEKLHGQDNMISPSSGIRCERISTETKGSTTVTDLRVERSDQRSYAGHNGESPVGEHARQEQNVVATEQNLTDNDHECKNGQSRVHLESISDKDSLEFTQMLKSKRKHSRTSSKDERLSNGTVMSKPKGILKELRKTKDNALSRLSGTPVQELNATNSHNKSRSKGQKCKGSGKSVRFGDDQSVLPQLKLNQSWISEDTELEEAIQSPVVEMSPRKDENHSNGNGARIAENEGTQTTSGMRNGHAHVAAEGLLTNAWSFQQLKQKSHYETTADITTKRENKSKSFLKPKEKVVFSTDEEDSDIEFTSSSSRLIRVCRSKDIFNFVATDPNRDTETDTEYSRFRLEDVDDAEVNYLSDSHITTPAPRASFPYNRSKVKRTSSNVRKYQSANLPRKRLYNPKQQTLSMLSLNTIEPLECVS